MKRMVRRIVSLMLAALLLVSGVNGTGLCAVSAEATEPVLAVGQPWEAIWDGDVGTTAQLHVDESGLYVIQQQLHSGERISVSVRDSVSEEVQPNHGSRTIYTIYEVYFDYYYLVAGCEYTIRCYGESAGSATVTLQKEDLAQNVIGEGPCTFTEIYNIGSWGRFTSPVSGDYRLVFKRSSSKKIVLIEEATGTYLRNDWVDGLNCILTLKENTDYVIGFDHIGSVTFEKCQKDTETIRIHKNQYTAGRDATDDEFGVPHQWFTYRVEYTDGTHEILEYHEIESRGYKIDVYFAGYRVSLPSRYGPYYCGGTQPCVIVYNDDISVGYVKFLPVEVWDEIGSMSESLRKSTSKRDETFDVKPKSSGVYTMYCDNTKALSSITYAIVDQYYNPVQYNEKKGGFPLVADQSYRVFVQYSSTADVKVWLEQKGGALFPDAHPSGWYYDAVTYMVGRGAISGYSNGKFGTSNRIQRQDFLVMLARFDGVDLSAYENVDLPFKDVGKNTYYEAAVAWGYENGIVTGYSANKFGVGQSITREQLATFLYRYAAARLFDVSCTAKEQETVKKQYKDYAKVNSFARDAIVWAIDRGVISGRTSTKIAPQGKAQRCEVAQMMYNAFLNDIF